MLEHAIAILEGAVTDIGREPQQTADVWEALRTARAAGADRDALTRFWIESGARCTIGADGIAAHQLLNASMNAICRGIRIERTYRRLGPDDDGREQRVA